jgi:hypothetical protein
VVRAAATSAFIALALLACGDNGVDPNAKRGKACASDADCKSLVCIRDASAKPDDLAVLPLVCDDAVASGAKPGAECTTPNDCASGVCLLAGACARPCADEGDCDARERCDDVYARTSPAALQSLSACVAMVDLPKDAQVEVRVDARALSGGSSDIKLDAALPGGSTLYVLEHLNPMWPGTECRPPVCVQTLRRADASRTVLFDADTDYANDDPPINPVARGDHLDPAVIMLPNGSADSTSTAGYIATLQSENSGDLRVTRLARSKQGKRLDLNVFYVGALDWEPVGTRGPPLLADALDVVDEIFAQADIAIGDVRQIAVPGELPMRGAAFPDGDADGQGFSVLQERFGVYMELPFLFRLSAGAANSAINLFFVADMEQRGNDGDPEAEAGGIPGPLGMQGTGASGIAIATNMMANEPQALGRTLAHEIAHYLGLFHTSESNGVVLDPLDDTPECRVERGLGTGGLGVAACEGFGADNLMFWAKTTGTVLTPQQQSVLQRALLLR